MHTQHGHKLRQLQGESIDLGDPEHAVVVCEAIEFCASPLATYHAIIHEWRTGCYDANAAVSWLCAYGLLTEPYSGDPFQLMLDSALIEFGAVELPERVSRAIPSVSRGQPFEPKLGGKVNAQ